MPGQFNAANYATVDTRIAQFYSEHPDGRIITEDVTAAFDRQTSTWRVKASIFLSAEEQEKGLVKATGHAFEIDGGKGANRDAALENCETSAIGRALANMGMSGTISGGGRPPRASREEMEKQDRQGGAQAATAAAQAERAKQAKEQAEALWARARAVMPDYDDDAIRAAVAEHFEVPPERGVTAGQVAEFVAILEQRPAQPSEEAAAAADDALTAGFGGGAA